MQKPFFWFFVCLLFVRTQSSSAQNRTVFKHANVIPMHTQSILSNQDVLVENGIIRSIQKSKNRAYGNATVVNATGKYLIPGLADMHVHLPRREQFGYGLNEFFTLHLAAGVTTVRSMRGDAEDPGIRRDIVSGKILAPDLFISAPPFVGNAWLRSDSLSRLVKRYKREGYDLLKVLSIPSTTWYDTLATITQTENIRLAGHAPGGVPIKKAIEKGLQCVEHLGGYETLDLESNEFREAAKQTAVGNVYNCPTLDWYYVNYIQISLDDLKKRDGLDRVPAGMITKWTKTLTDYHEGLAKSHPDTIRKGEEKDRNYVLKKIATFKALHKAGCQFLISPDASSLFQVPGLSLLEEMNHYKAAGLSNYDILRSATINAATYFGEADKWGSIQSELRANLVLLQANPLADLANLKKVDGVMIRGQWLSESQLKTMVQVAKQKYHE